MGATRVQALRSKRKFKVVKCTKAVDEVTQAVKDIHSWMCPLDVLLKAKEDCVFNVARDKDARLARPGEAVDTRRRPQDRDKTLRGAQKKPTAEFRELECLRCAARVLDKGSLVARTDMAVQSSLREESLE